MTPEEQEKIEAAKAMLAFAQRAEALAHEIVGATTAGFVSVDIDLTQDPKHLAVRFVNPSHEARSPMINVTPAIEAAVADLIGLVRERLAEDAVAAVIASNELTDGIG